MCAEIHIENRRLNELLDRDLKRYEIVYLQAPSGWGKYTFLKDYRESVQDRLVCWVETEEDLLCLPAGKGGRLVILPRLEEFLRGDRRDTVWRMLKERRPDDRFIFASDLPVPEEMLVYVASRSLITYGLRELRPDREEVGKYFRRKDLPQSEQTLIQIEKDLDNIPLCIYMLENPLRSSPRGYTRAVLEQCLKDICSYLDVTCFRTFPLEIQEALLGLSCFEVLTPELIGYMRKISPAGVREFLQYLVGRGSVIEPCGGEHYCFCRLFGMFLKRIVSKYLDLEEHLELYRRAMSYFLEKEDYLSALQFAVVLKDEEQIAALVNRFLGDPVSYSDFIQMEEYFLKISPAYLRRYPRLLCAGAMLEALMDNLETSDRYVRCLDEQMSECGGTEYGRRLWTNLVYLQMFRPGPVDPEVFPQIQRSVREYTDVPECSWARGYKPSQLSILHGDRDFCELFAEDRQFFRLEGDHRAELEQIFGKYSNGFSGFVLAELYYEYNWLDRSLDELSRGMKEARQSGSRRLEHMCGVLLADLLMARNQAEGADVFLLRQMEEEDEDRGLYYDNYLAHRVYYDLLRGEQEKAEQWMKDSAPDESGRFCVCHYNRYLMKARVYIWQEKYMMARLILQSLQQFAETYGMSYLGIQTRVLEAVVYYREGNPGWKEPLLEALRRAGRYGFVRVIADEGGAVYGLLQALSEQDAGKQDEYFRNVLNAARAQMLLYPKYLKQKEGPSLQEFSSYEKDVLRLLALGEKNSQIARTLCVSENTVKYHLKNIYQKLNVNSRSQAVKLMSEYHLL